MLLKNKNTHFKIIQMFYYCCYGVKAINIDKSVCLQEIM